MSIFSSIVKEPRRRLPERGYVHVSVYTRQLASSVGIGEQQEVARIERKVRQYCSFNPLGDVVNIAVA